MEDGIFRNDVLYMKSLTGKTVSIVTVDNKQHIGNVYVIDPVYKTVAILDKETNSSLDLILHHAIKSFEVISDDANPHLLHDFHPEGLHPKDCVQNKVRLCKWLRHMFIEAEEDGDYIKVDDHLKIGPPYSKADCMCDNTIVLERIRSIIDLMPPDFE